MASDSRTPSSLEISELVASKSALSLVNSVLTYSISVSRLVFLVMNSVCMADLLF